MRCGRTSELQHQAGAVMGLAHELSPGAEAAQGSQHTPVNLAGIGNTYRYPHKGGAAVSLRQVTSPARGSAIKTQREISTMVKFLRTLAVESAFLGCLYAWKVLGIPGAGNVVVAWLWLGAVLGILPWIYGAVGNTDGSPLPRSKDPAAAKALRAIADTVAALALVWFGHFGLAALIGAMRIGVGIYDLKASRTAKES
jgi:hypothetical protein